MYSGRPVSETGPVDVIEYTDAMCSWAWGTEPKLRLLRWRFEDQIDSWRYVMGHLVEDEHMPDRDPVAQAPKLQDYWKVVCDQTGMPRPDPLRRSTTGSRASGLAVKAAQHLGGDAAEHVLRRMRQATFVDGEPADDIERAVAACRDIDGLDVDALAAAMADDDVLKAYQDDTDETRSPNDYVLNLEGDRPGIGRAREAKDGRMRFVFPTIVVRGNGGEWTVPGWMPYEDYEQALLDGGAEATERTRSRPSAEEAFARWPTLADHEFRFLCGSEAELPAGIITTTWNGGVMHRRPVS